MKDLFTEKTLIYLKENINIQNNLKVTIQYIYIRLILKHD